MMIFKENKKTGLQCGINDYGSGYNLTDTPENREHILVDFDYTTATEQMINSF